MKSSIKTLARASLLTLAMLLNHSAFAVECISTSDCGSGEICVGYCQELSSTASTADSTQSKTNTKKK